MGASRHLLSLKGSTVFNGKPQNLSHEHRHDLPSKSHPVQVFREFTRIFLTFRENSRQFVAKKLFFTTRSRPRRESPNFQIGILPQNPERPIPTGWGAIPSGSARVPNHFITSSRFNSVGFPFEVRI